ncbi:hypothetical protein [Cytophaga sp. FL35]|uniref:hypothetical protein n=1 Tax=Cytophaga sp. FL35 TaxID=1904456 RepID=UPI00165358E0|nr:hypothetical protein [Cytophaga sp. FL35]MBC6998646.1 hypothetical protein [Cytophaga sp. FL35]
MELDRIEKLLSKYLEGSTSLPEEAELKAFFSQDDIPAHLAEYRPMFAYFKKTKQEKFTKGLPLQEDTKLNSKKWFPWLSVAASVLIMIGLFFGKGYYDQKQLEKEKAQYAYKETKKALDMLAENFSRGTEKVAYLNEFVEAKEKIYNKN